MQADPSDWLTALGKALRAARLERGLTQERLGLDTGIHRNYVGGIERGQRSPAVKVIVVLANHLQVSPADLFSAAAQSLADGRGRA